MSMMVYRGLVLLEIRGGSETYSCYAECFCWILSFLGTLRQKKYDIFRVGAGRRPRISRVLSQPVAL